MRNLKSFVKFYGRPRAITNNNPKNPLSSLYISAGAGRSASKESKRNPEKRQLFAAGGREESPVRSGAAAYARQTPL